MSRGPDAGTLLQRALVRTASAGGCDLTVAEAAMTRWASATFTGARHRLVLTANDDAAFARWIGGLSEAELPLRGHLLADVAVMAVARADNAARATIEALTLEE